MTQSRATYQTTADPTMLAALNEQLQGEVARLRAEVERLKAALTVPAIEPPAPKETRPGWWIITPSPYYSGETLGVVFTRGQAYLSEDQQALAMRMADELGYSVLHTPDYTGPYERPDTANRPTKPPPEPTRREVLREIFRGYPGRR